MKFTKSLIATGVLAAASTASAKTTMSFSSEAFYQQKTWTEDEPDTDEDPATGLSALDGDQKVAQGFLVDNTFLGFSSEWAGFKTNVSFFMDKDGFNVETINAVTSHLGGKLELTLGLQDDMVGGMVEFGQRAETEDRSYMSGVSAKYNVGAGNVTLLTGRSHPVPGIFPGPWSAMNDGEVNDYYYDIDLNPNVDGLQGAESDDSAKFLAGPFFGLVYDANYGALDLIVSYHTRSTGEYKLTGAEEAYLDATRTWMTLGANYNLGSTDVGFEYSSDTLGKATDADEDTVTNTMVLKVSHAAGMWVPSFSYATLEATTDKAVLKGTAMELDVAYTAGKGHEWFFAYNATNTEGEFDGEKVDGSDYGDTSIYLGARFGGDAEL